MKQLIFTFFAIILCYSLFFDNDSRPLVVDEQNYIYEDATPDMYRMKDTLNAHTYCCLAYDNAAPWNPCFPDELHIY
ncbi:MAG: hypothetical protein LBJ47_03640, partial [Tannerella sp.]|nr:hypothetical protein [Tannerella sp.]